MTAGYKHIWYRSYENSSEKWNDGIRRIRRIRKSRIGANEKKVGNNRMWERMWVGVRQQQHKATKIRANSKTETKWWEIQYHINRWASKTTFLPCLTTSKCETKYEANVER